MKNNLTFRDAISIVAPDKLAWYDAQDTDTKYQDECDVLLDVEGNPVPDKYASITSDNADYFEQQQDEE